MKMRVIILRRVKSVFLFIGRAAAVVVVEGQTARWQLRTPCDCECGAGDVAKSGAGSVFTAQTNGTALKNQSKEFPHICGPKGK